jgi:hypothetical protein
VTETKEKFKGLPLGSRAVQIADGQTTNYFLTTFGRAPRDTVHASEASTDPTLSQALHLLNGNTIGGKIRQGKVIEQMLEAGKKPAEVVESLYIRCKRTPVRDSSRSTISCSKRAANKSARASTTAASQSKRSSQASRCACAPARTHECNVGTSRTAA